METRTLTVVTGGASGIGAACVRHHVKRGDTVIVLDLASAWSDQKASSMGAKAFYDCDVLDDQRVRDVAARRQAARCEAAVSADGEQQRLR